mgnify:CR=1 FL=1
MPNIRPSADLRNKYTEISDYCHESLEPVFITKNGKGDLAVMSIEAYENMQTQMKLYRLLGEGLKDEREGKVVSARQALKEIRRELNK